MNTLLGPIIFIILSVGLFFTFTDKEYTQVKALQQSNKDYEKAIADANNLLKERDQLLEQYNAIPAQDLENLKKLIPDNIDNVKLIIEVNAIMQGLGLPTQNIKVDIPTEDPNSPEATAKYNSALLTFTVSTSYENFQKLLKKLESSLRMLDITDIKITATESEPFQYAFSIKTYWMK